MPSNQKDTKTTYIVTFEVNDKSIKRVIEESLPAFGECRPIHENCFAIRSILKPPDIRDILTKVLGESDGLFIIRSGTAAAWKTTSGEETSKWLKENL